MCIRGEDIHQGGRCASGEKIYIRGKMYIEGQEVWSQRKLTSLYYSIAKYPWNSFNIPPPLTGGGLRRFIAALEN